MTPPARSSGRWPLSSRERWELALEPNPTPVLVDRDESVSILTLNRPDRLNAVSPDLYRGLEEALREIESDSAVRAAVITGAGRAFCVGADLKSHAAGPMTADARKAYIALAQSVNAAVQNSRVPVVAAVNGHAIGAGLELALSADFVLVAENAKLRLPEIALGTFVGGGVTYRLPQRVGDLRARELILGGDFFSGDDAVAMGLANRALPAFPGRRFAARACAVRAFAGGSPILFARGQGVPNQPGLMLSAPLDTRKGEIRRRARPPCRPSARRKACG